ncbi:TonB-dependent receptor [Helicobacter sp. T3_23-1056]
MKPLSLFSVSLITSASLFSSLNAEPNASMKAQQLYRYAEILRYAQYDNSDKNGKNDKENKNDKNDLSLRESALADSWQSTPNATNPQNAESKDSNQDIQQEQAQSMRNDTLKSSNENYDGIKAKELEKVSVTAQVSQSELPLELQSKQISIVEKATLLEKPTLGGAQSALESVPGILYSRSGGINGQITFRGQNSTSQRSIVMIDGVRFAGRSLLEFNVLDPYQFESIEVIRGAASALWGSEAMNGVVNFRSRRSNYNLGGDSFKATARVRALEYNSVNNGVAGRAEILGGGAGWDLLIGASARNGGDYLTPIQENGHYLKAKNSYYTTYNADFNIGYTTKNNTRYYAQGRYSHIETSRAGGLAAAPGADYGIYFRENPMGEYYLRLGASTTSLKYADNMDAYVYYRYWDTDLWNDRRTYGNSNTFIHQEVYANQYVGGRIAFDTRYKNNYFSYGAEILSSINLTPYKQNFLGSNKGECEADSCTTIRPNTNTNFALFLKDDWKVFDNWILSGAIRGDYVLTTISKKRSDIENNRINNNGQLAQVEAQSAKLLDENPLIHTGALTGSIGSVWFITDYISNVINVSHNFVDPGASARLSSTPSASSTPTFANPQIKPEYSQTAEFGFRFTSENHFASIVGFYTNYQDMVLGILFQDGRNRYENIGRAFIAGAELEGRHNFLDSMIMLNYALSYNYGQDLTANKPIAYLAPLYGNLSLKFNFDKVYFVLTERFYGGKNRTSGATEYKTKEYAMTDIYAGLKLGAFKSYMKDMELIFGVSNLFNTIGRNPVTVGAVNATYGLSITNPLVEPARNFSIKYVWKY